MAGNHHGSTFFGLVERYSATQNLAIPFGMGIVTAGIALFFLFPVVRVIVMLVVFIRERDYPFVAIAGSS
jgi:uncharacterized membrane protein